MKYSLFLVLLIPLNSGICYSQTYISFPDSGAIWRQSSIRYESFSGTQICYEYQFEITGEDTVINGTSYNKIFATGTAGPNGICDQSSYFNVNDYAIREDSLKHVFIYFYAIQQEILVYDFNLNIGDTIPPSSAYCWTGIYDNFYETISYIDSILVDGIYHKQFHINSNNSMGLISDYVQIIEGIGSTFGLFSDISPNWAEKYDYLNCFYLNNQLVYFQTQPCSLFTSLIEPFNSQNLDLSIYPNPIETNELQFFINKPNFRNFVYEIYNSLGNCICRGTTSINNNLGSIKIPNLTDGIYFLKINIDGHFVVENFIKLNYDEN